VKPILVFGRNGQVGSELTRALRAIGEVTALGRTELDLTDADAIRTAIRAAKPEIIVNAAAYTAVDKAESEPDLAMQINAIAPGIMAGEALRLGALLVHYSTDYVFDGAKPAAYTETDVPNPLSVYGRTKLAGEQAIQATGVAHYILRTSWVYAAEGANFLNTILRLARERPELRIVNDQTGSPTWARAIAYLTAQILSAGSRGDADPRYGLYHLTASGAVTWFGFAQAILAEAEKTLGLTAPRLVPITTAEYPLPARRPANSRLDTTRLTETFGIRPSPWQEMLAQCMQEKRHG
jgi:dTDP-4-dehydrorhamnose reductase